MGITILFDIAVTYLRLLTHKQYKVKMINVLIEAIYNKKLDVIDYLLTKNINPDKEMELVDSVNSKTPLMLAASLGYSDIVKILIHHGANINKQVSVIGNKSALHSAIEYGKYETAKTLLEYGADVNMLDAEMCTPMHLALLCNPSNAKMVSMLLKYGADIDIKDVNGESPVDIASKKYISDEIKDIFRSL